MEVDTRESVKSFRRSAFSVQRSAFSVRRAQEICEISTLATLTVLRFRARRKGESLRLTLLNER
jgi:hypothetical protein